MKNELIARVKNVSRVRPFPRVKTSVTNVKAEPFLGLQGSQKLVAIGASTGGPAALARILNDLPQDFSTPLVIVQHIARDFIKGLAEWLGHESHLCVKIAAPGNCLSPRTAFLAPDDCHLTIGGDKALLLTNDPAVNGHRPSINRLMESAARFGKKTVGVLLTGMGSDGAEGLKKIRMAGGTTIVQDESTSLVFGMPQQAIRQGAAMVISPLADIAKEIVNATLSD